MLAELRQSLITRLMMYFLIAGFVFVVLFGINLAHGIRVHFKQEILPNIAQYLVYIAQDIGSPPDLDRARQLTRDLTFQLGISGPGINWESHHRFPRASRLEFEQAPTPYEDYQIAHYKRYNFVRLRQGDYEFTYGIGQSLRGERERRGLFIIAAVVLSLLLLFWLIRRSLHPINEIGQGVARIASGELEQPIEPKGSIEFKRLAQGINTMASQINSMLHSKHQLLLAISHELRSPLTRAKVNVELLPDHASRDALVSDLNEMEGLITSILESERLNQRHAVLNKSQFDLSDLINDVLKQYFGNRSIESELKSVTINADKSRISLLIKNLLDNAIKYSADEDPPPRIRLHRDNDQLTLEVEDFGCGMQKDELEFITQAFYRVDQARQRKTGGYGLGLYLCQLIIDAHGGQMTFQSQPKKGTLVVVRLPDE